MIEDAGESKSATRNQNHDMWRSMNRNRKSEPNPRILTINEFTRTIDSNVTKGVGGNLENFPAGRSTWE